MKKQILFLSLLVLAVMASVTNSYAQTLTPRVVDCIVDSPLSPTLYKTYTYSVDIPNDTEFTNGLTYQWFVTKNPSFIASGALSTDRTTAVQNTDFIVASGTYDAATANNATIQLSWNTLATPDAPYFLVVNAVGTNEVCSPHNMKVYMIVPENMFTLDIMNVNADDLTLVGWEADGSATLFQDCYSNIVSATWNAGTNTVEYDYGTNTLIWAVTAANWATSWSPSLQITGVNAGELISSVTWSRTADGATVGTFTDADADGTWTADVAVTPSSGTTVGQTGEIIYIRMILDHTDASGILFEGIVDQNITLAIDGVTALGEPDVHYTGAEGVCGVEDGFTNDNASQDLLQRPSVISNTVDFATPTPNTEEFLTPVVTP